MRDIKLQKEARHYGIGFDRAVSCLQKGFDAILDSRQSCRDLDAKRTTTIILGGYKFILVKSAFRDGSGYDLSMFIFSEDCANEPFVASAVFTESDYTAAFCRSDWAQLERKR